MAERPQCCISRCLTKTKSIKVKDIIYYLFPTDSDWSNKWEKRIKEFDPTFRRKSNDIVCSLHFAKASMKPVSRQLVDHALPIYFPNTKQDEPQTQKKLPVKPSVETKCVKPVPDSTSSDSMCCIVGCRTKFDESNPQIHGFRFPDDAEQRKKWLFIIGLYNNQQIEWEESMKVCALHFTSACFIKKDQLCEGVKPSVFKDGVARRKAEIAQEQTQARQVNSQRPGAIRARSINVPLHKSGILNQSMTQRSAPAPVVARRLSLPYSRLPKLLPKPLIARRGAPTQINGPNGVINVHRIGSQNVVLSVPTSKATHRPLPALNKVVTTIPTVTVQSTSVLRKSMPPPTTNTVQSIKVVTTPTATPTLVPIKRGQITRLPPTLKPAPRVQMKGQFKTYSRNSDGVLIESPVPVISKVHCIERIDQDKSRTPATASRIENANTSSQVTEKPRGTEIVFIEDEESEIAKAIGETNSASVLSSNENLKNAYIVRNDSAFQYPRMLLDRILGNKRKNEELELEAARMKKICIKMYQNIRLQSATSSGETIEIS